MSRNVSIVGTGVWKSARGLFADYFGSWAVTKKAWGNDGGEWKQCWPPSAITFDTVHVSISNGLLNDTPATITWSTGWSIPGTKTIQRRTPSEIDFSDWMPVGTSTSGSGSFLVDPLVGEGTTPGTYRYRGKHVLIEDPSVVAYSAEATVLMMPVSGTFNVTATTGMVGWTTSLMTWSFDATKPGTVRLLRSPPGGGGYVQFATGLPTIGSGTYQLTPNILDPTGTWFYRAEFIPDATPTYPVLSNEDSVTLTPFVPE